METEGFAIYDAMMQIKTEVCLFSFKMIVYLYFLLTFIDGCL